MCIDLHFSRNMFNPNKINSYCTYQVLDFLLIIVFRLAIFLITIYQTN